MPDKSDPAVYRELAAQVRVKAGKSADIPLTQSYFELAAAFEMLADTLERIQRRRIGFYTNRDTTLTQPI